MNRTTTPLAALAALAMLIPWHAARAQADTVPPSGVEERPFGFTSGTMQLAGTLALPAGAARPPIAVIVAGSGPTDRNGNARAGLRTNAYAQLAWGLAARGIASLRYDKRVLPTAKGQLNLMQLTFYDFAADLVAAVGAVRADYGKVVVIGHSEGGDLAIQAAANGVAVDGLVLIATPGRKVQALLHEQIGRQVPPPMLERFDSAFARYIRGEPMVDTLPAGLRMLLVPVNQRYTQTWAAFDPVREIAKIRVPILIVQGEADIQVSVTDALALKDAQPNAELVRLPGMNHVLKAVADTAVAAQAPSYTNPTLPVVPALVETVAGFIGRVPAGR
jgi:pimeloyl-ACP methyl ester carboxylesterase